MGRTGDSGLTCKSVSKVIGLLFSLDSGSSRALMANYHEVRGVEGRGWISKVLE